MISEKGAPLSGGMMSQSISRVLSRTIIHLRRTSPFACSDLPESAEGHGMGFLFGLAPGGVYHRHGCYQPRGALLPHLFTLTCYAGGFLSAALSVDSRPPGVTWRPDPLEPGLSSVALRQRSSNQLASRLTTTGRSRKLNYPAFFPATSHTGLLPIHQ